VSIDVDGTIADYHRQFFYFAEAWLGTFSEAQSWINNFRGQAELNEFMGLDKRLYRQIKLAYRQGGMKRSMPTMPGFEKLMDILRHLDVEVWITTTRPYLQVGNIDDDTREWLRRNNVKYDHILYSDNKYDELRRQVGADRVACVLEDQISPEYVQARICNLNPILVKTPYNHDAVTKGSGVAVVNPGDTANGLEEAVDFMLVRLDAWRNFHDTVAQH
jgi:hypothetical protein